MEKGVTSALLLIIISHLECLSSWKANTNVHSSFGSEMFVILFQPTAHDEQSELHSGLVELWQKLNTDASSCNTPVVYMNC